MTTINLYAVNKFNAHTGYGKMEVGLFQALTTLGVDIDMHGNSGEIGIITGSPLWADDYPHERLWAYTMSESTKVSPQWVEALNAQFERVLVPCPPLVDVYKNSGVEIPVHSVPLGVDLHVPEWKPRRLNGAERPILTYSLGDMRKNAQDAMLSWHRVFQDDPQYPLMIKCRDNPKWMTNCVHPGVTIVRGEQTEAQYQALMDSAAVFIFVSRGEGFGLPPREAVLMGIPTIATQWLGMWDAHEWAYPVSVLEMWPSQFTEYTANATDSEWVNISRAHLDEQLRFIIEHYEDAVEKTRQGRDYLLSNFTWRQTAQRVMDVLEGAA